jgi:lipopolysaccharide/colanic/teichoic acid biosynthesis glycosyltransferase
MQPNAITVGETPVPAPAHEFVDDAPAALSSQLPLREANLASPHGEFAAHDYQLPNLAGTLAARAARRGVPYAAQSTGRQALYDICKRGTDVSVSAVLIVLALPLLVVIAITIKVTSPGPVLFRHRRLGRHGREFECFKFRTMVADAEEQLRRNAFLRRRFEETYKIKDDPRITRVGAFLRRTSLDELPQLWQVLKGEMTLVGPRPIVKPELAKYSIYADKLLSVKPGLSGMWQVCGRSDTTYPQRVMMDMHYIDHRCFSLDTRLLLSTVTAVLRKSGAC